jgi:probable phosphoglycerate mutase
VQAEEAGRRLAALLPDPGSLDFVASPLRRTRDTMEIMRGALGMAPKDYRIDERLKELTFGRWEGLTWREVRARDAASAARRERDKWHFVPPEGESYVMLADRLGPVVAELAADTVMVSHGGVARALLAILAGVPEHEAPRVDIWQGKVLVIESGRYRWA